MRQNLPVTNEEYHVPKGIHLVSKTDLRGTITECNDAFELASGYSRAELIGQPHNMIRHPEVPSAVFKDMWETLQKGLPWTQMVKNRRKDGSYYWVKANATPLFEKGEVVGYMSVRSAINEQEKSEASQAYTAIKNDERKIRFGKVYKSTDWRKYDIMGRLSLAITLPLMAIILNLLPMANTYFLNGNKIFEEIGMAIMFVLLAVIGWKKEQANKRIQKNLLILASNEELKLQETNPDTLEGKVSCAIISAYLAFMQEREEALYQLDKSRQLQLALDKVSSNVMMADKNHNITYLNEQLKTFLSKRESKIKEVLPKFDMRTLIGSNIDIFHKNPAHNRAMLQAMSGVMTANIQVSDFHFELALLPVTNRAGVNIGTMVEWKDKTQEVILMNTVDKTVRNAQKGYLQDRIDLSQLEGVAYDLSESINDLMASISEAMQDVTRVTTSMANGNLTEIITKEYEGDLKELKDSINASISRLDGIVALSIQASHNVDSTASEVSQSADDLSDRVQNQAAALEETSATMHEMNATIQTNSEHARSAQKQAVNQSAALPDKKVITANQSKEEWSDF